MFLFTFFFIFKFLSSPSSSLPPNPQIYFPFFHFPFSFLCFILSRTRERKRLKKPLKPTSSLWKRELLSPRFTSLIFIFFAFPLLGSKTTTKNNVHLSLSLTSTAPLPALIQERSRFLWKGLFSFGPLPGRRKPRPPFLFMTLRSSEKV